MSKLKILFTYLKFRYRHFPTREKLEAYQQKKLKNRKLKKLLNMKQKRPL